MVALLASPFIALVPAVALKLFHQQARGTSVLVTAQGVGAVIGALALASLVARWGRRRVVVAVLVALPVALVGYAAAPTLALAAVA
ncbi:MAG: MFS transporter, partial [Acidimicrobiales bacterium]